MLRRSPLKAKRDTPRRNEGRVAHGRMKPKATGKTSEEAAHMEHVASLGCLICEAPANIHHVMHAPGKAKRRDHRFIVPLCKEHHQGKWSVHDIGSEVGFMGYWSVDLVAWCIAAWERRHEPEHPFWTVGVTRVRAIAWPTLMRHKSERGAPKDEQRRSTRSNQPPEGGATD